ncbi:endopeptidase La [Thermospira aquatica]|uniref:Lon protease n=1 Tax=Thermospira aquatica TaxID=2828656 RepID=A0AAX3BB77_9SPIR|nr:endopeptidase La [Thermospira aquatica]URA09509.1 endopeptidase La [Thermospira aquatica]
MADKERLPIIPLKGVVVFPHMVVPLIIGRPSSMRAVLYAYENNTKVFLVAQKDKQIETPTQEDMYKVGCVATIMELLHLPNGLVRIVIQGEQRAVAMNLQYQEVDENDFPWAEVVPAELYVANETEIEPLFRSLKDAFFEYIEVSDKIPKDTLFAVTAIETPEKLVDAVMANISASVEEAQAILEENNLNERLTKALALVKKEIDIVRLEQDINQRVQNRLEKQQKKYILNEQLKEIQRELHDTEGEESEEGTLQELREKMKGRNYPDEVKEKIEKEMDKLRKMPTSSPEYPMNYNYVEWIIEFPWNIYTQDNKDITLAEEVLEKDHYGLKEVKERILDFIAIRQLNPQSKGPILCFVGPPGTGKTSLAQSIARALNRNFVRFSLGGVRDEAEIRGHRRTYIGALPGKIVQLMRRAGSMNPVFLLDEVDKMSMDFRGDPSAALLEVLDPEQNHAFNDHYFSLDIDLSYVFFLTTANNVYNIPEPLRDRMEIIEIPGYTELEKKMIAKNFLLPKQCKENGLGDVKIHIPDEEILQIIRGYTREAGLRSLERHIGKIVRKVARERVKKEFSRFVVTHKKLEQYLGIPRYDYTKMQKEPRVGVVAGMAWTESGGDVLYIESTIFKGKGNLILTGNLGEVMQESAKIAFSYARSIADQYNIPAKKFEDNDLHIHVPQGAIPKDGPSAGITMLSSIVSTFSGRKVRHDIAMTGELTLKGDVLAIGGLREKLLATKRAGIYEVIIPRQNEKDISDIAAEIKKDLTIHYVEKAIEVLDLIFLPEENVKNT